MHTFTVKYL